MHPRKLAENNFAYLLCALLIFFLLMPVLRVSFQGRDAGLLKDFLPVGFSLLILVGVWGLQGNRRLFHLGLTLALVQVGFAVADRIGPAPALKMGLALNMLAFCVLNAYLGARHVFSWRRADTNTLIGAVCVYLLLGFIWALLYAISAYFLPDGAFNGLSFDEGIVQFDTFLYYSFVTLTSSGYGDITPVNPLVRTLSYLEMITGQFYMAILVAGLVGLFMGKRGGS